MGLQKEQDTWLRAKGLILLLFLMVWTFPGGLKFQTKNTNVFIFLLKVYYIKVFVNLGILFYLLQLFKLFCSWNSERQRTPTSSGSSAVSRELRRRVWIFSPNRVISKSGNSSVMGFYFYIRKLFVPHHHDLYLYIYLVYFIVIAVIFPDL